VYHVSRILAHENLKREKQAQNPSKLI